MSWWSGKPPLELIDAATSEAIPSGEQNLALNFDITDMVRSKRMPADQALKVVRRRLYNVNPNVQILTLHLLDLLVKNGGSHFLAEVATKEFMDAYIAQVRNMINQDRSSDVVELMLEYLQSWALLTKSQPDLSPIYRAYEHLKSTQGIEFPAIDVPQVSESFLQTATPPAWVDSDTCMKSGQPFTFYNRKHHCRNCGGVFLQEYCKDFLPLPHFGIVEPVRVCVDCKDKLDAKQARKPTGLATQGGKSSKSHLVSNNSDFSNSKYDQDLRRALALSVHDSQKLPVPKESLGRGSHEAEMDEDMKAAIAASLADMEAVKTRVSNVNGPTAVANATAPAGYQSAKPVYNGVATEENFQAVQALRQTLETAQPQDPIYNQSLVEMNRHALGLQPQVVRELTQTADKLQLLEDLHGRMMAISGYYDRLLDAELRPKMQLQEAQPTGGSQSAWIQPSSGLQYQTTGEHPAPAQNPQHQQYQQLQEPSPHQQQQQQQYSGHLQQRPSYAPSYSHVVPSAPPAPANLASRGQSISQNLTSLPAAPSHKPELEQVSGRDTEPEAQREPEPVLIEL